MEINLSENIKQIIVAFILLIAPLLMLLGAVVFNILNSWYFVAAVIWFGMGIIFFSSLNDI